MTDDTLVLTFPCSSIVWDNGHFIQIDTKMTREDFLVALMKSMDGPIVVKKKRRPRNERLQMGPFKQTD